jgi:hypothetical protein
MMGISFGVTHLGMALIALNVAVVASSYAFFIFRGNAPLYTHSTSYKSLWAAKVLFAILLSIIASSEGSAPLVSAITGPVSNIVKALGPGYFIAIMVLDIVFAALLLRLEFYKAYSAVVFNVVYIPVVNIFASLIAYFEQRRTVRQVRRDVSPESVEGAAVLGYAVKSVRVVEQVVRSGPSAVDVRRHLVVKHVPAPVEVVYSPVTGKHEFNPHLVVTGSSGTGKTTTVYSLVTQLMENYPIILFDVKGDYTEAVYERRLVDGGKASVLVASAAGINPFAKVSDETPYELLDDLMDSMSVLEEVGAKQAHFMRDALAKLLSAGKPLTYEALVREVSRELEDVLSGKVKYGPQTRDALQGIAAKLSDLGAVFKSSGVNPADVYAPLLEKSGWTPLIIVNLAWVNEKNRAIVLELLLRKLHKVMTKRSSLAYLTEKPVVVVVDEAYIVAKPVMARGGRDAGSKSKLEDIVRTGRSFGVAFILSTQRLSDLSDGIRQSCFRWVVFNTPSPEDIHILSSVAPANIVKLVNDLKSGEAYIRMPNPDRHRQYGEGRERIIVEGYMFNMRRELLRQEKGKSGLDIPICSCGYVKTSTGTCLNHRSKPVPEDTVAQSSETRQKKRDGQEAAVEPDGPTEAGVWWANGVVEDDVAEKTTGVAEAHDGAGSKPSDWSEVEAVRLQIIQNAQSEDVKRNLEKVPLGLLAKFYTCYVKGRSLAGVGEDDVREMVRYGLLKFDGKRVKPGVLGRLFIKHVGKGGGEGG